ncbi:hypothetical protein BLOT_004358 [Blomia tropicalis]|nr:hypothetical protein BLOT_004358 [Blomia tropicalis]
MSNVNLNSSYNVHSNIITIKQYSTVLPYRVIEALSSSSRTLKNLTTRISDHGWAWLVSGRRLFVWRYLDDHSTGRTKAPRCFELTLPPSDIAHRAELICILSSLEHRNKFPSALAVSPEGTIRYWSNISQEGNTYDSIVASELQGQECHTLIDVQPFGCVLGTTTNSLVHIAFSNGSSNVPILCQTLKTPQGLLSGIGRKVTSLIFGSLPTTHASDSKQLIRIVRSLKVGNTENVVHIFVLTNCVVQRWTIQDEENECFDVEIDLERQIKEAFINKLWNRSTTHHNQLVLYPMDIAMKCTNEVLMLVMCVNNDHPNEPHIGLFTLNGDLFVPNIDGSFTLANSNDLNVKFKSFQILPNRIIGMTNGHSSMLESNESSNIQQCQLNIFSGNSDGERAIYVYNSSKMFRINLSDGIGVGNDDDETDEIDFQLFNDYLFSAVALNQSPLLFTFKNGFVSIHSNDSILTKHLSVVDRKFVTSNNTNKFSVLKRALHLFTKQEKQRAELMVKELFPWVSSNEPLANNAELDDVVCALSTDICDQIPQTDPRWAHLNAEQGNEIENEGQNSVNYVIITNQLEDKLANHLMFVELLQNTGAWNCLTSLTTSHSILPSKLLLCEHTEKLLAAVTLRKLHIKYGSVLETAIAMALEKRKSNSDMFRQRKHLTNQDIFYREVTKIDELFWELINLQKESITKDQSNMKANHVLVMSIADIMTNVFSDVCVYRRTNGHIYKSAAIADCDYVPWSSIAHVSGVREALLNHFDLLVKGFSIDQHLYIPPNEEHKYNILGQKLIDLSDIILDSYVTQLSNLSVSNEKYSILKAAFQNSRYHCLMALLRLKLYERAASLAEKYEDFDILIKICEELNNHEQLQLYTQQFADKGFSEHLFDWYLREGKQGKMLSTVSNNYKLTDFLSNHEPLSWLHQIHLGQFKEASSTLKKLGSLESMYPNRKKTLLSLGKLASIASNDLDYSDFDDKLKLLNFQEGLSDSLLDKHSLERNSLKVLSPEQLIDIFTSGVEGPNEDIRNFKTALEIADLAEKHLSLQTYKEMILHIWRRAFMKDDWTSFNPDNYETPIKQSFFYQLALLYFGEEKKKLPPIQDLARDFEAVTQNEKTSFFLQAAYELILH